MTFESAVFNYLKSYSGLSALVGDRIAPMARLQEPAWREGQSVVYELDSDVRYQQFAANPTGTRVSLRVTAFGRTSALTKNVAIQLYNALQGYTLGTDGKLMGGWEFTAAAATDLLTKAEHGFSDTNRVRVANSGGSLPGGLSAATDYYVRDATTNTFKLAATSGGSAIDITSAGTGIHTVGNIVILSCLNEDSVDDYDDNTETFIVTQEYGVMYRL